MHLPAAIKGQWPPLAEMARVARRRAAGLTCLVLACLTLAVFWPVTRHDFVNYDDPDYVTSNPQVQKGLTWDGVRWAFRSTAASNWHPLTWLSHLLDYQLFGLHAGWHHLINLLFHTANTLLLFLVLNRMTGLPAAAASAPAGALWRSAVVAGLFALHPLHVESVAWISERKDVLSAFFGLLTLWAYARYAQLSVGRGQRSVVSAGDHAPRTADNSRGSRLTDHASHFYFLALVFFALGLMSKPMLVTLPFVLLLVDHWPLRRLESSTLRLGLSTLPRLVGEKLPFFALAAVSCVVTFFVQRKGGAVTSLSGLPVGDRIGNALVSYVRYLGKMFWPEHLAILYPHPGQWPVWQVAGAAVLLAGISLLAIRLARRAAYVPMGWFWFVGMLVPVIGLVQVGIQAMADRYSYLPLVGLFIIVVWGAADLARNLSRRQLALAMASILVLGSCGLLTRAQLRFWQDSEALFRRAVEVTKNNYLAYNNLGFYLSGKGQIDEAMRNYERALEINPYYEDALNNLGYALAGKGRHAEAIPYYEKALRLRPKHIEVHNNLGNALAEVGRLDEAIRHYAIALELKPSHADAHNNLGIALAMLGKLGEAVEHLTEAVRLKPNHASAHSNLGNALAAQRKLEDAIRHYREALRLQPDDPQAHNNLGNVLAEQEKLDEAIGHYRTALRLRAHNPEAHFNLGIALARKGQREQAVVHYKEALRLRPDYEEARRQLNALAESLAPE